MDKSKIKSYAIWARKALIGAVGDRAAKVGINKDGTVLDIERLQGGFKVVGREDLFNIDPSHRDTLVRLIKEKGYEQVLEEVAYTWFNRFMGLRFMEVNDYLPTGVRVLSSEEGKAEPDVLSRINEVAEDLNLNLQYVYELQDKGDKDSITELYKYILIKQCNELGNIIPQMFEKISDYTELLLPDNLLELGSVIRKMVEDIAEEDWQEEVEIIGWMYQYYISEKKDEVFAALKKNVKITKENIPAATQLFTPKWIVKYMVENSLGRLWLEGHPNEELQKEWKYYLEEAKQEPEVEEELKKIREEHSKLTPEDIKVLDPCMGSGHILVYAFDVFYEIYKSAGYSEREIPRKILQNNLYGLDIDDRAAQLASFALIMKARHYNRRLFREIERENIELNLCSIQESNGINKETIDYFCSLQTGLNNEELRKDLEYLTTTFTDAKEYGSILEVEKVNFEALKQRLKEIEDDYNFMFGDYRAMLLDKVPALIKQAEVMSRKYYVSITNPPYMSNKGMNEFLRNFVHKNFKDSKGDLFSIFMERLNLFIKNKGIYSMINQHSWMFLSSYEELRHKLINNNLIINMIHLGTRAFEEIGGEVVQSTSFVVRKLRNLEYKGKYIQLTSENNSIDKEFAFLDNNKLNNSNILYYASNKEFLNINGKPFSYWISLTLRSIFTKCKYIKDYGTTKTGMTTGDNDRFLRLWNEVDYDRIAFECINSNNAIDTQKKWFPYSKGGGFRRWGGLNQYIINWYNDGFEIKNNTNSKGKKIASVRSEDNYFKECISWSSVTSYKFSSRITPKGYLFDSGGSSLFVDNNIKYFLGLMNSKIAQMFLDITNNTMNYQPGDIARIPIISEKIINKDIQNIVNSNINLSKNDWDSFETSWDFKTHPLLKLLDRGESSKINSVFSVWETGCEEAFVQLKDNEDELNKIFIDIYGLQDELTPEVEDKDITIRKADRERDIKSFISYAVGCMFGRYSIDTEGLVYAGGEFTDKWDLDNSKVRKIEKDEEGNIVSDSWVDATFLPDRDNVIPITEDEYFDDDIVARFIEFVKKVYGEDTLEENLDFIAESLGKKANETSRQTIRRYFLKDFYKDHLKVYQKRPIYWLFDSGKNDGFKALVYMHRYNESTVAKVRTDYLHMLQRKYEATINTIEQSMDSDSLSARDKTAYKKKIDRIKKQIEECRAYDQVVAHVANEKISIDLDDGVKHNYALFQGVEIPGDNGKVVKKDLLAKI